MRRFVVNRATWANADTTSETMMLDPENGLMCCLGQICHQAKTPKSELAGNYEPCEVPIRAGYLVDLLLKDPDFPSAGSSDFASKAMDINDNSDLTPRERERALKKLFKSEGIDLSFVGRMPRRSY